MTLKLWIFLDDHSHDRFRQLMLLSLLLAHCLEIILQFLGAAKWCGMGSRGAAKWCGMEKEKNNHGKRREAAEERKTFALALLSHCAAYSRLGLASSDPKKISRSHRASPAPTILSHPARALPPRKGTANSQPPTLLGLRRGNMSADTSKSTYNGLARPSRSSHVIVDGVSTLCRAQLCSPSVRLLR
jgi:hypothetical protein